MQDIKTQGQIIGEALKSVLNKIEPEYSGKLDKELKGKSFSEAIEMLSKKWEVLNK